MLAVVDVNYPDRLATTILSADGMMASYRSEVAKEATRQLLEDPDETSDIKNVAVTVLRAELREEIRQELRESLKSNPTITDEVMRELKRQIMGL